MIMLKRLLIWSILFGITLLQFLLYIPNFSCMLSAGAPVCAEQFSFTVIGGSKVTREIIASINELLRLISYLAIDLGWSNELADPNMYNDENLVDTFNSETLYKVSYFGYCKKTENQKIYCVPNGSNGMDVISVLVRDVGIQLGKISSLQANDTQVLGDSLVVTYHLALNSIRKFIRGDRSKGNAFFSTFLEIDSDDNYEKKKRLSYYSKGVDTLHYLLLSNKFMLSMQVSEVFVSMLCLLNVIVFGIVLAFVRKQKTLPPLLKGLSSLLLVCSTVSLLCSVVYFLSLKILEPTNEMQNAPTGWELLQLRIGKGFIINCLRYLVQLSLLPLNIIVANHYSVEESSNSSSGVKERSNSKDEV